MFRFILFVLIASLAVEGQAQVDGAMAIQGSATFEPEKPLTMAGGIEKKTEQKGSSKTEEQKKAEEFDVFLFQQIRRNGVYKNPMAVKKVYAHLKAVELAVREEHAKQLAQIPEEDKEAREKLQRQLDAQTPIRFHFFEKNDEEVNALINSNPEMAMYFIVKNTYGPDYGRMTEAEQKEYINRSKAQYKARMGYSPEEYLQKYVDARLQEKDQNLNGQPLIGDTLFVGDGQIEESEKKK